MPCEKGAPDKNYSGLRRRAQETGSKIGAKKEGRTKLGVLCTGSRLPKYATSVKGGKLQNHQPCA